MRIFVSVSMTAMMLASTCTPTTDAFIRPALSVRIGNGQRAGMCRNRGLFMLADDFGVDSHELEEPEVKEKRVKMFGGWLDSTVAGRDALSSVDDEVTDDVYQKFMASSNNNKIEARRKMESYLVRRRKAGEYFSAGVRCMKSGRYNKAVESFSQAIFVVPDGVRSREGGEYSIWLAQALDADGQKGKAIMTIRACKVHSDRDVQRVAAGVEFIMLAPKLQAAKENFAWIDFDKIEQIKDGGQKTLYAPVKKMPEKYSLEWYMMQKPKTQKEAKAGAEADVAIAASAILAGLVIYASYIAQS